jgi:hypothetical protein
MSVGKLKKNMIGSEIGLEILSQLKQGRYRQKISIYKKCWQKILSRLYLSKSKKKKRLIMLIKRLR